MMNFVQALDCQMDERSSSQVIVVGAGPTGLMLAAELSLGGADVTVIEQRSTGTFGESRAPGINARTMEIFGQRNLAQRFLERGRQLPAVLFSGLPMMPKEVDPDWPDALILPQSETERILGERVEELGVPIRWSTELLHLAQDTFGVDLIVDDGGEARALRAQYVVGCDGGHSAVRRICGLAFPGDDPVSHWIVADVQLGNPPNERESFGRNTRIGTYQVSRAEPDWYRVSLMKLAAPNDRNAPVTLDELRQAMLEGLGTDYGLLKARWMSRFADGCRQVDQYRHGRVFLAGDAAHTHSPIGGQGLNLGIQDAVNLGWKLGAVVAGASAEPLLDTYHQERHPVAERVLELARAQTALIKPGHQIDALRNVVGMWLDIPEVMRGMAGTLSGLALRYPWGADLHPLVGRRMPNLSLLTDHGKQDTFTLMHSARPLLLSFNQTKGTVVPDRWISAVDYFEVSPDVDGNSLNWHLPVLGSIPALAAAFVRPDGYVAWVEAEGEPSTSASLADAMERWLG